MSKSNYSEVDNIPEINDAEDIAAEDGIVEGFGPVMRVLSERYCDNLVDPDEEKCIESKKLYITLGAAVAGSVLLFLFLGWLLCYCPLKTSGYAADDFIRVFNSIAVDDELRQTLEGSINAMISGTDVDMTFVYPDFSDMTIPEDADLEEGVRLCNGNMEIKAELVNGYIQKMTVTVPEDRPIYDSNTFRFVSDPNADFDYSSLAYFAVTGKTRLVFYNLARAERGEVTYTSSTEEAIAFCNSMRQGAIYDFADAEDYSADQSYFEYLDNMELSYTPVGHVFTMDTHEKALCGSDNGLYRFFDSIFGEGSEKPAAEESESDESGAEIAEDSIASSGDASGSDAA